jgi:hypothetical protein
MAMKFQFYLRFLEDNNYEYGKEIKKTKTNF